MDTQKKSNDKKKKQEERNPEVKWHGKSLDEMNSEELMAYYATE